MKDPAQNSNRFPKVRGDASRRVVTCRYCRLQVEVAAVSEGHAQQTALYQMGRYLSAEPPPGKRQRGMQCPDCTAVQDALAKASWYPQPSQWSWRSDRIILKEPYRAFAKIMDQQYEEEAYH